jgi:iron uptake system component EfeO
MNLPRPLLLLGGLALLGAVSACGSDSSGATSTYDIKAGDKTCDVAKTSLDAGKVTFKVENVGSDVTEVYVYGKSGETFTKIMGEKENIGPGTSQDFDVNLSAGDYEVACKPGMVGDGIRTPITVTGSGGGSADAEASYDRELEFEVETDGTVKLPEVTTGTVGERIEFKLENDSGAEHYLELFSPDGEEVGEGEAHAGTDAEFVAELEAAGDYQVKVFEDGKEQDATTLTLTVTK